MAVETKALLKSRFNHSANELQHDKKLWPNLLDSCLASPGGTVAVAADALPIPVTADIVTKTTGGDAEALTLADGVAGQILVIKLAVDGGGDGTLTPATSTGWATIVFADAGDSATLRFVDATVGWTLLAVYGLTAQPVVT